MKGTPAPPNGPAQTLPKASKTKKLLVGAGILCAVVACGNGLGSKDSDSEPEPTVSAGPAVSTKAPRVTAEPTPTPSDTSPTQTPEITVEPSPAATTPEASGDAATVLATLPVKGRAPKTGYRRGEFGQRWRDIDRNGCDTRNDILNRDLTNKTWRANTRGCVVLSGVLAEPYSGETRYFDKSQASAIQIDHVVALSDAWQKGAQALTAAQRETLANDPLNLLAVDGRLNQQKSDGDAATWLPPHKGFRCAYVSRQIAVKAKYRLWVTEAERDAMVRILSNCPGQALPADSGVAVPSGTVPESVPPDQPASPQDAAPPAANPAPQPGAPGGSGASYANCREVWAILGRPITPQDPGFQNKFDRDNDGVGCESRPR